MKTTRLTALICTWVMVLAVAACAASPALQSSEKSPPGRPAIVPEPVVGESAQDASYTGSDVNSDRGADDRMIVRTASLSLVVADTDDAVSKIKDIAGSHGGYVVDTHLWRDDEQLRGSITVRVPADSLEEALGQFKSLAVKVERETGASQDVTEDYTDLGARLLNLEAAEEELRELLATVRQRTGKAEDILAVHRELTSIRSQIEQLKGRMQYLERTAAMSAVAIELIPDVLAQPIGGTGWRPSETVAEALGSLLRTLRFLVDAAIVLVLYVAPLIALILFPLVVIWLGWQRWRRRGAAKG